MTSAQTAVYSKTSTCNVSNQIGWMTNSRNWIRSRIHGSSWEREVWVHLWSDLQVVVLVQTCLFSVTQAQLVYQTAITTALKRALGRWDFQKPRSRSDPPAALLGKRNTLSTRNRLPTSKKRMKRWNSRSATTSRCTLKSIMTWSRSIECCTTPTWRLTNRGRSSRTSSLSTRSLSRLSRRS